MYVCVQVSLGPAILNGGVTTFLAVIILPFSQSHVFQTFFKIFGLTVLYGLFHGLVFLPALLITVGPETAPPKVLMDLPSSDGILYNSLLQTPATKQLPAVPGSLQQAKLAGAVNPVFTS